MFSTRFLRWSRGRNSKTGHVPESPASDRYPESVTLPQPHVQKSLSGRSTVIGAHPTMRISVWSDQTEIGTLEDRSDTTPVRGDAPADLGTASPDGLTGGEYIEARLAKKGQKRGEVSEECPGNGFSREFYLDADRAYGLGTGENVRRINLDVRGGSWVYKLRMPDGQNGNLFVQVRKCFHGEFGIRQPDRRRSVCAG